MAEDKLKALEEENAELKKEIEALKIVNEPTADAAAPKPLPRLSFEERTFKAKKKDKQGKEKAITAVLLDVSAIRLEGRKLKAKDFMQDEKLQQIAVDINHPLIQIQS